MKDVTLSGADGLFVFVTEPKPDPRDATTVLVTPIGATPGRHELSFDSGCPLGVEHHDVTFGPEVPYPTSIGRIVTAEERFRSLRIEIELSAEAAAYVPVTSFTVPPQA